MNLNVLVASPPTILATHLPSSNAGVTSVVPISRPKPIRRRIPPSEGRALEILGHAIEYLADEFAFHSGTLPSLHSHNPQVQAIHLLMSANRQIYFSCPEVPSLKERLMSSLFRRNRTEPLPS
jgi:hypothetical protein